MKAAFLAFLLLIGSMLSTVAQPLPQEAARDQQVIIATLAHLRTRPRVDYPANNRLNDTILLNKKYEDEAALLGAYQIQGDLMQEGWSVPEAVRLDMVRRTRANAPFPAGKFPAWVQVVPPDANMDKALASSTTKQIGAKYQVSLWPPGYSADGKQALVRFLFGPGSPHGSDALYWLELRRGRWRVIHHLAIDRL